MHDDEKRRTRVNLAGALFLVALIALAVWVVRLFAEQEALQRCLDSRRSNCFPVEARPSEGPRLPAR